jgi:hypothetical protein
VRTGMRRKRPRWRGNEPRSKGENGMAEIIANGSWRRQGRRRLPIAD